MNKYIKIKTYGKKVCYFVETDWERKTLVANGFRQDDSNSNVMYSYDKNAEYIAKIVKVGGI